MGWDIGYDHNWKRDVGYGVPAHCDHPGCKEEIDRGLSYVCGGEPDGGDFGCGLHFCGNHLSGWHLRCERCRQDEPPFEPKPDHRVWMHWKLTDKSRQEWRDRHPADVAKLQAALGEAP